MWTCARAPPRRWLDLCVGSIHGAAQVWVRERPFGFCRFQSRKGAYGMCVCWTRNSKALWGRGRPGKCLVYFIVIKFFLSSVIELRTTKEIARSRSGGLVSRLCHVTHSIVKKTETAASRLVRVSAQSLHTALRTAFKKPYGLHMVIGGLLPQRGGGGATPLESSHTREHSLTDAP